MDANDLSAKLSDYFAPIEGVEAVFMFGSTARGDHRRSSDLDLAVLLDHATAQKGVDRAKWLADLFRVVGRNDIDLVILNRAPAVLKHRILRDGRVAYVRSNRAVAEFSIRAMQEYVDTKPIRKLQHASLRRRLGLD